MGRRKQADLSTHRPIAWCEGDYGDKKWYYYIQPPFRDISCVGTAIQAEPPDWALVVDDIDAAQDMVEELTGSDPSWMSNQILSMEEIVKRARGDGHVDPEEAAAAASPAPGTSLTTQPDTSGFIEPVDIITGKTTTHADVQRDLVNIVKDSGRVTHIPPGMVSTIAWAYTFAKLPSAARKDPKTGETIPLARLFFDEYLRDTPAAGGQIYTWLMEAARIDVEKAQANIEEV